jgi:hypothetical protein
MTNTEKAILEALEAALRVMGELQVGTYPKRHDLNEAIKECRMARMIVSRKEMAGAA